jgi:hypothetical protein
MMSPVAFAAKACVTFVAKGLLSAGLDPGSQPNPVIALPRQ